MRGENNSTLLHRAAFYNSTSSCIRALLRLAPHLLDTVDIFNFTPLMMAVMWDNLDTAKMLLQAGANVRMQDCSNRTVFDLARVNNEKEMWEILKQYQQVSGIF